MTSYATCYSENSEDLPLFLGLLGTSLTDLFLLISHGEDSFGHLGDTVTYEGFYHEKLDTLAIPITGGVTTSPSRALAELAKFDRPLPKIVLMHWVFRNPEKFCKRFKTVFPDSKCVVPKRGQALHLE